MATKPSKRRSVTGTARKKRATPHKQVTSNKKPSQQRTTLAGIDEISAADLDPGARDTIDVAETARPMSPRAAKEIELAAGDLDASFHGLDSGEEAPGGSDPLPDQDDVDRIGSALGVVEQDEKPLATTEKIEGRDRERWELDPASAEDFEERQRVAPPPRRRRKR